MLVLRAVATKPSDSLCYTSVVIINWHTADQIEDTKFLLHHNNLGIRDVNKDSKLKDKDQGLEFKVRNQGLFILHLSCNIHIILGDRWG